MAKRGNGELPHEINLRLREFLAREATEGKMPQLRWYFELTRDFDALKRACAHPALRRADYTARI